MSVTMPPRAPSAPTGGNRPSGGRHGKRWLLIALAVVVAAGLTAGLLVATGGTGPTTTSPTTAPTSPTTEPGSSTTEPGSSTTAPAPAASALENAVYPTPGSRTRFAEPVPAARGFAVDFVGFVDPVVGPFVATGAEEGTVALRANATGVVTTVHLRRVTSSWWVLGSSTPDIRLSSPEASAAIASPVRLQGESTAFEAQVNVHVRQDGQRAPIGTGYVMGGSMGQMGPFDASVAFGAPTATRGALLLSTVSMQSGNVWEATVVRVAFAPTLALVPTSACPGYAMGRPVAPTGEMVVTVFYSCGVDAAAVPTYRVYPTTSAVLRTALDQLLAGPSAAEKAAGLTSWFSSATAGHLRSVTVTSGAAAVDFGDLRSVIPNASSSAGSHMLLAQLDATVLQFASVTSVVYSIDGSCQAFGEWLQGGGCVPRTRASEQ